MQAESCNMNSYPEKPMYIEDVPRPPSAKKKPTECGARLAALRKAAGLSQVQLAKALEIPQRTISFYEREGTYIPSTLLPGLAKALGVSIEEILGVGESQARKRGPKSRLERQLESIGKLPRNQQEKILAVVEAFIAQHAQS